MCELYCHGCKKPLTSCPGHDEIYLWVDLEDLYVDVQVILDRDNLDHFDDFDDFDDWGDLDHLESSSSTSTEAVVEDYSEFNNFLEELKK